MKSVVNVRATSQSAWCDIIVEYSDIASCSFLMKVSLLYFGIFYSQILLLCIASLVSILLISQSQ